MRLVEKAPYPCSTRQMDFCNGPLGGTIVLDTTLTGTQKRRLRAMGSLLEPVVQVGKLGVAETVVITAREAIGPRELIKVRVLPNCPQKPAEVMAILADRLAAELVQVIGRKGLLYKRNADEPKIELP